MRLRIAEPHVELDHPNAPRREREPRVQEAHEWDTSMPQLVDSGLQDGSAGLDDEIGGRPGSGAYAPMPPVLGPLSPSYARLKSCAGSRGTTVVPSVTANSDTSGPSRNSSITTRRQRSACATAAARSSVTRTPLPPARPSSLTTYGGPKASSATETSDGGIADMRQCRRDPRGGHDLLGVRLGSLDLRGLGRRTEAAMPCSRRASATPATSGASGPMTTSSARRARGQCRHLRGVGGIEVGRRIVGQQAGSRVAWRARQLRTASSRLSASTRACSRAPLPMTTHLHVGRAYRGPKAASRMGAASRVASCLASRAGSSRRCGPDRLWPLSFSGTNSSRATNRSRPRKPAAVRRDIGVAPPHGRIAAEPSLLGPESRGPISGQHEQAAGTSQSPRPAGVRLGR